jgi:hypothetical protein
MCSLNKNFPMSQAQEQSSMGNSKQKKSFEGNSKFVM